MGGKVGIVVVGQFDGGVDGFPEGWEVEGHGVGDSNKNHKSQKQIESHTFTTVVETSKPNERSCRIFLKQLLGFPPVIPFFFVAKIFVSNFAKKCRIFFSMKNFRNFFQ